MIKATILNAGIAEGLAQVLTEPLSFWGAFDPRSGRIIDTHHPQCGKVLSGTILLMRESRGSGTAPGAIAEALRLGTAPAAIILITPDINLAVGAAVATRLYGKPCPVLAVTPEEHAALCTKPHLYISDEGTVTD